MTINFLDLEEYRFKVSDSKSEKIISKADNCFESHEGEILRIEQLPGAEAFSPFKAVIYSLFTFLITAVRALIIPTQTLYHKRSPLFLCGELRIKKEYSESSVYYVRSQTEPGYMNFSKPELRFDREFELVSLSYFADSQTVETNRKKQSIGINASYILLYVLVALFAAFGVSEKNFTVMFICASSLFVFILCHFISLFRAKRNFRIYKNNSLASAERYNQRKE